MEKGGNPDVVVEIQAPSGGAGEQNGGPASTDNLSSVLELSRMEMNLFNSTLAQPTTIAQASSLSPSPSPIPTPTPDMFPRPPLAQPTTPAQAPSLSPSTSPNPTPTPDMFPRPPLGPAVRRRSSNSKSRIAEPPYQKLNGENVQTTITPARSPLNTPGRSPINTPGRSSPMNNSPKVASPNSLKTPRTSAPITPRTPLMESVDEDDDDDNDNDVYKMETRKLEKVKRGKKMKVMVVLEWITFTCVTAVLIASLTIRRLKRAEIWDLELWKWCVQVLVIFCGRLFTEWLTNSLVFLIEKNFLLKRKVLYFVFGLKKSVRVVIWLALILLAWALLINRGVRRSEDTSRVLNYITRGIVSTLVGAFLWMVKTFLVKIAASKFHVRTYFDRIQESIFHQYILQALSGPPLLESADVGSKTPGQLSFTRDKKEKQVKKEEVIDVDKLYKIKREKVSAWTMGGLIKVIRNSELQTVSEALDESVEEYETGGPKAITCEVEAREAANSIFRNVARPRHKYIDEDDLLRFMPKEEVDNAIPLFEGAAETRRIKKSSFRNWVVKAYYERKCLAVSLSDAKTAIEELNKLASGLILIVIVIVWLLIMEIATTRILVFIASQLLLLVFMFGNTARMTFEAIIFVFIVHPFDVGDRCVIDGQQMIVDEMNIMSTIFLKPDNEKVYYPNSVLAVRPISNFNRSPEMMGDAVEFAVDFTTSVESIASLKAKIKAYLESKPQHWSPNHSVQVKEIVDVNKMIMALYVTHTINFQNAGERGDRRSDLVFQLKKIFEELGIMYRLLPQEVQISYVGAAAAAGAATLSR